MVVLLTEKEGVKLLISGSTSFRYLTSEALAQLYQNLCRHNKGTVPA